MKGLILIPAFNEEKVILDVLKKIPKRIDSHSLDYVVINDGSTDKTEIILEKAKANFLTHPINRGLGAALSTGFEYAKLKNYDFLITLDGDGQHDPKEIRNLISPIVKSNCDFIIGSRIFKKGMPKSRKILTFMASLITYFYTNVWTTDSQSGFRAFSKKAINLIIIEVDRMEVSTDFFNQAKEKKLKMKEVSIKPIYTDYSIKKGQNFLNSFNIISRLTINKLSK